MTKILTKHVEFTGKNAILDHKRMAHKYRALSDRAYREHNHITGARFAEIAEFHDKQALLKGDLQESLNS